MSLDLGEGGRLLVKCHTGCDQHAVFKAVLERARELGLGDAKPKPAPRAKAKRRRTWPAYEAKTGELVAEHVREEGPKRKKVWWSMRGVRTATLALYRYQKLVEYRDRPAVICEEEPAADALAGLENRLGVVALGTVKGASGTPCNKALEPLRGRIVYLWPDNDNPGRRHTSRIGRRLRALGVEEVRVIHWPNAPEHGDAFDAVTAGMDIAELLAAAKPWVPEAEEAREAEDDADPRPVTASVRTISTRAAGRRHTCCAIKCSRSAAEWPYSCGAWRPRKNSRRGSLPDLAP